MSWELVVHLLCTYHLGQNVIKHIRPLFSGTGAGKEWNYFYGKWWKVVKNSSSASIETFDTEWETLTNLLEQHFEANPHLSKAYNEACNHMDRLRNIKQQWASRWTCAHFTRGCHSTQRQESVQGHLKLWFNSPGITVLQLAEQISSYRQKIATRAEEKAMRETLKRSRGVVQGLPPLLKRFELVPGEPDSELVLTEYAIKLLRLHWNDRENWVVTRRMRNGVPDNSIGDDDEYDVVRIRVRNSQPGHTLL
mmetsp:Transcript_1383/g.2761  ORF Transcript_1383/g.2761 Transcript_1383/m.2761 type:complete len:251 (+) Transcript_1383:1215-1967(+)